MSVGQLAAYVLVVAVALIAGGWASVGFHRRNPNYRSAPAFRQPLTALLKGLSIAGAAVAVSVVLVWLFGDWNGVYLAGLGTFIAVEFVGLTVWPVVRASR